MTLEMFLKHLSKQAIDSEKVTIIQKKYGFNPSNEVSQLISLSSDDSVFIKSERRFLPFKEILNATEIMHVDFVEKRIIPFIDCYDNDFIVYDFHSQSWSMFNIVDQISFNEGKELKDLL